MTPYRHVTIDGVEFKDYSRLEVTRAGAAISVTMQLTDPYFAIVFGALVVVTLGRVTSAGVEPVVVASGPVVGRSRVQKWRGDAVQFTIDPSASKLLVAPENKVTFERKTLLDILKTVYRDTLGYTDCVTNLPPITIERFEIEPTTAYHAAMVSLVSGFSPRSFPDPITGAWCIYDTRRPLPAGLPTREVPLSETTEISDETPAPQHVNVVRISYYDDATIGEDSGQHPYTDREVRIEADKAANGQARSETWQRIREYRENPKDPTIITRAVQLGLRKVDYNAAGDKIMETKTTKTYRPKTYDQIPLQVIAEKQALVTLPSGGQEFLDIEVETTDFCHVFNSETNVWEQVAEFRRVEGEVLEPDEVKLTEGSREGLTDQDSRQTSRWLQVEHSHVSYQKLGPIVSKVTTKWDDLNGGVLSQFDESYIGTTEAEIFHEIKEFVFTDDDSIADPAIGRRPEVTFDGTIYGLENSKQIVRDHIFGGYAAVEPTASIPLRKPDPTFHEGVLVTTTDRAGAVRRWFVVSVTDTDSFQSRETATRLSVVEIREAT